MAQRLSEKQLEAIRERTQGYWNAYVAKLEKAYAANLAQEEERASRARRPANLRIVK